MSIPILATKLFLPPPRRNVVHRARLLERLNKNLRPNQGFRSRLTLISAPAGFGKSTLVSEWIVGCKRPTAWLSLDKEDHQPTQFLAYLVAALQTIAPQIGQGVVEILRSPPLPPVESIFTALLNEINLLPHDLILVFDDYDLVDNQRIDHAIAFLVDHLPPQMHLVIATREDPHLPLARLRARGQLTELRAADLRFIPAEATEFVNQVMGLGLSAEHIAALEDRTEGWIAGLQLATLSLQGHQDVPGFVRAFAGDHRYIVDYLVEEVLQRQPEPVRSFLLQTAILDRFNGPLCDAVTGYSRSSARLEALERGNFFMVPLDDRRHWYRYHHLFAEVLSAHLMAEHPDQVPVLHQRASEWFEQNGSETDAIRHALAAEAFERAADLIERALPAMRRSRQDTTTLGWFRALPNELFHYRPVLSAQYGFALLGSGEIEGVEARLRDAERWLDMMPDTDEWPAASPAEMVVVDEEEFRRLPGSIAMHRAGLALVRGDIPETVTYVRRALELAPVDDHFRRGGAMALLGLAYWASGDLEAAHRSYAEGMAELQQAGNIYDTINGTITLAAMRHAQGRLREAMRTYERGFQFAMEQGETTLAVWGTADLHVGMSTLYREQNDLRAAIENLLRSKELGEHTGLPRDRYRWRVAMARIREAEGDLDGALDLLYEAERLYVNAFSPNVRPIAASRIRMWLAQGRLVEAIDWVRDRGLSVEDDLSYLREFEHITLTRVLFARYQSDRADHSIREAMGLLQRLQKAAEEGERTGSIIEILVMQALGYQVQGDIAAALASLQQAMKLAEPEGYVRMFVDEGPPMAQLLREAAARGIMPGYTGKLLAAFDVEPPRNAGALLLPTALASQRLVESLSQRELEVLRLFETELSGPEIADQLVIALSTLRTHTKGIFGKLNVTNRRSAVKRATELDLI